MQSMHFTDEDWKNLAEYNEDQRRVRAEKAIKLLEDFFAKQQQVLYVNRDGTLKQEHKDWVSEQMKDWHAQDEEMRVNYAVIRLRDKVYSEEVIKLTDAGIENFKNAVKKSNSGWSKHLDSKGEIKANDRLYLLQMTENRFHGANQLLASTFLGMLFKEYIEGNIPAPKVENDQTSSPKKEGEKEESEKQYSPMTARL